MQQLRNKYQVKISNRFSALENLDDSVHINRAWENIRQNINISGKARPDHYELKQHKPRFGKECSELLDRRKQAKLQWL
jgi:hypothetical protein